MTTIQQVSLFIVLSAAFRGFVEALAVAENFKKSVSGFPSVENGV
jgi:hypothetical protein